MDIEKTSSVRYENVARCFVKYGEKYNTVRYCDRGSSQDRTYGCVSKEECYEVPEMKRAGVLKPVEKTAHDTKRTSAVVSPRCTSGRALTPGEV